MVVHSAGILPFRREPEGLVVLACHMGGPLWSRKEAGAWSLAKGEFDPAVERPEDAARREFGEETGLACPDELIPLGNFRVTSRKVLHAFACEASERWRLVASNTFEMEWPPRSGRRQHFPEMDRAEWMAPVRAREALVVGQRQVLDALLAHLAG